MNRIFGSSKGSTVPKPTLNDTSATLDSRVETLNKQIASIDQELQAYSKLPPARKSAQKTRAMALLSKKRMYEKQRMTLEGQAGNINATAFAVSNIQTQKEIFNGLKVAKKELAKGTKELNINKVENLMDDLDDQMFEQEEMNDVFSRPMGQDMYLNDGDLEAELAGLAEEEFGMESNAMFNDLHAPSVPVHSLDAGQTGTTTKDGVMVDEFGLPKLPASGMRN